MAGNPGAFQWVGGLSCATLIVGCVVSTDLPPAQPSSAGSLARNVILFIGDGMGVSTVTAAPSSTAVTSMAIGSPETTT